MNWTLRCSLIGLAAGIAAATVWTMIVVRSGALFSTFAPAIGAAVGVAMRIAATSGPNGAALTRRRAITLGFIAILISAVSIAGGKLAFFSGLIEQMFGAAATWEAIRVPFFQSFVGLRGLYSLAAFAAAYGLVASAGTSPDKT